MQSTEWAFKNAAANTINVLLMFGNIAMPYSSAQGMMDTFMDSLPPLSLRSRVGREWQKKILGSLFHVKHAIASVATGR